MTDEHTARSPHAHTRLTYTCRVCAHSNIVRVPADKPPKIARRNCEKCGRLRTMAKGRLYAESGVGIDA